MNREHVVQIGFSFDEDEVVNRVKQNAEKAITAEIKKELEQSLFNTSYYGRREGMSRWLESLVKQFLAENRDAIIEAAAQYLCESMKRTKAVREAAVQAVSTS